MRTEAIMKVVVFERALSFADDTLVMRSAAEMLAEAAEWIRSEMVREVAISSKKKGMHRIRNISTNWEMEAIHEGSGADYVGDVMRLYLHYDDNEKA